MATSFPPNTVLILTGPTGIGKTELSMAIAETWPVEIVSADSRQIYRYMDIGTAKPSQTFQQKIPHHFIDILNPDTDFSAGQYCEAARETITGIFSRGKLPLVVGGSGLYIRALTEGFFKQDVKNADLRETLAARLSTEGALPLYEELEKIDPAAAEKVHPNNVKRVMRYLELALTAGKAVGDLQMEKDPAPFRSVKIALTMPREKLYQRIEARAEKMFELGLVNEVKHILEKGYSPALNSLNSVGYKEVISYLNNEISLERCIELVKQNTRRYAKRQFTWFRKEKNLHWLEKKSPGVLLPAIVDLLADT